MEERTCVLGVAMLLRHGDCYVGQPQWVQFVGKDSDELAVEGYEHIGIAKFGHCQAFLHGNGELMP